MSSALLEQGLTLLEFARRTTLGLLETVSDDKICHQPVANANHAAWVMGHLASTDDYFVNTLEGSATTLPKMYEKLFGMGSTPTGETREYPSKAELMAALKNTRTRLITYLRGLDEQKLAAPLPKDLQMFAPTPAALPGSVAWHEGLHAGQVTVVRKSLGQKPLYA